MKKFYYYLLFLPLSLFAASSCSDSDNDYDYISLMTVVESDSKLLFMKSDSSLLNPTNFTIMSNAGQRMLVQYEIENTLPTNTPYKYEIEVYDYDLILTKDVIDLTAENEVAVGNDAFWRVSRINPDGGFINIYMSFLYNGIPHMINLVENKITPVPAPELATTMADTIKLELRQNANGNNSGYPISELVSFNIQKYITEAVAASKTKLTFSVSAKLPNGAVSTYNVVFNIGKPNTNGEYNDLDVYSPTPGATL